MAEHNDRGRDHESDRDARERVGQDEEPVALGERARHEACAPNQAAEEHHGACPEAFREGCCRDAYTCTCGPIRLRG